MIFLSFTLSGALGAGGWIILTPITTTSYDVGPMLALKGFLQRSLGYGSMPGAVVGDFSWAFGTHSVQVSFLEFQRDCTFSSCSWFYSLSRAAF